MGTYASLAAALRLTMLRSLAGRNLSEYGRRALFGVHPKYTSVCSSALTARLLQPPAASAPHDGRASRLTPTERRIVQLIAADKSSEEIGVELSIHYRTIENHRTTICRKLGLEGVNALLPFALQNKNRL